MSGYVCFKCGLTVHRWLDGWKHSSGGGNPRTPKHRQHVPVPAPREDYERAFDIQTPVAEARALVEKYRS